MFVKGRARAKQDKGRTWQSQGQRARAGHSKGRPKTGATGRAKVGAQKTHLLVAAHNQDLATSKRGQSDTKTVPVQLTHRSNISGGRVDYSNGLSSRCQKVTVQINYIPCMAASQRTGHTHSCGTYACTYTCMCIDGGLHTHHRM